MHGCLHQQIQHMPSVVRTGFLHQVQQISQRARLLVDKVEEDTGYVSHTTAASVMVFYESFDDAPIVVRWIAIPLYSSLG